MDQDKTQASLDSFPEKASTGGQPDTKPTSKEKADHTEVDSISAPQALKDVYSVLNANVEEHYTPQTTTLSNVCSIEPQSPACYGIDVSKKISVLPQRIGRWELALAEPPRIIYTATGEAFDDRWGQGAGTHLMELYCNDSGANRDGKYHRRHRVIVGFENPDSAQVSDIEPGEGLLSPRGWNPSDNTGDYGMSTGTKYKADSIDEGLTELLLTVHFTPSPVEWYVTKHPPTAWTLTCLSPRMARWEADAPAGVDGDSLIFAVNGRTVYLRTATENGSTCDRNYLTPKAIAPLDDAHIAESGKRYTMETAAAALTVAERVVTTPPHQSYE